MFPSELTERHIKIKMNEKNMKNKFFFKRTRCRCNGKPI